MTKTKKTTTAVMIAVAALSVIGISWSMSAYASGGAMELDSAATVVQDSVLLTGFKTIGPKDYIHLYDTTPYMIMSGHVAAKIPCDSNAESALQILIGKAPDLKPAEMEYISELSNPGQSCLYHVDLASEHGEDVEGGIVTDVAVYNPTDRAIRMYSTDTVFVGINAIMPLGSDAESDHDSAEMDEMEEE